MTKCSYINTEEYSFEIFFDDNILVIHGQRVGGDVLLKVWKRAIDKNLKFNNMTMERYYLMGSKIGQDKGITSP